MPPFIQIILAIFASLAVFNTIYSYCAAFDKFGEKNLSKPWCYAFIIVSIIGYGAAYFLIAQK